MQRTLFYAARAGLSAPLAAFAEGRPVRQFEKVAGWRDRYAIERLREALDGVAECRAPIGRRRGGRGNLQSFFARRNTKIARSLNLLLCRQVV